MTKFKKKERGSAWRPKNRKIIIAAEGTNVTERQYFESFLDDHPGFDIEFVTKKGATDPETLMENIDEYWEANKKQLSADNGDEAFIVLDLDCHDWKGNTIKRLAKASLHATFIVSNPCFEIWFLLHYQYSTHYFAKSKDIEDALNVKGRIPNYSKTMKVYGCIKDRLDTALTNADRLARFYNDQHLGWPSDQCNPRTDVPKLIRKLLEIEKLYRSGN